MNWSELFYQARRDVPQNQVNWASSPWGWLIHTSSTVKNRAGLTVFRGVLDRMGVPYTVAPHRSEYHLLIGDKRVRVHTSAASLDNGFRFGQLRTPDMDVDMHYLLGIEPHGVRVWRCTPEDALQHGTHHKEHVKGLRAFSFSCDEPLPWLKEVNVP